MNFNYLQVFRSKKNKFRVMIVGQPSYHIMDWRGCNFRRMALPKELRRDFTDASHALAYERWLDETYKTQIVKYASVGGDGAWFQEAEMVMASSLGPGITIPQWETIKAQYDKAVPTTQIPAQ